MFHVEHWVRHSSLHRSLCGKRLCYRTLPKLAEPPRCVPGRPVVECWLPNRCHRWRRDRWGDPLPAGTQVLDALAEYELLEKPRHARRGQEND